MNTSLATDQSAGGTSLRKLLPPTGWMLHPLVVFSAVWLGVVGLYSLHLSYILRYSTPHAWTAVLIVWVPFALLTVGNDLLRRVLSFRFPKLRPRSDVNLTLLQRRLRLCFRFWLCVTIVEIIASGGVPLVWALVGSSKTYVDFGIPSVHGFMNSLQVAIAISQVALFFITGKRRELRLPLFYLVWCIIIINRNMMLVSLIEFAIVFLRFRGLKFASGMKIVGGLLIFVLLFGVIGDLRQGDSSAIRTLAQPTEDYPDWLPSGILWAYIYITTPINNLIYNMEEIKPIYDPLFPSTVSTLFPSVLRDAVYGNDLSSAESGELVVSAFNVSTAFVGPFRDFGYFGTALFSSFIAIVCSTFWPRRDLKGVLMFAVVTQCLVLTLFFDHFFYLPVITQLVWLWIFFLPPVKFRFAAFLGHLGAQTAGGSA